MQEEHTSELPENIEIQYSGLYADRLQWPLEAWEKLSDIGHISDSYLVVDSANNKTPRHYPSRDVMAITNSLKFDLDGVKITSPQKDGTWEVQHSFRDGLITLYPQVVLSKLRDKNASIEPAVFARELDKGLKKALARYLLEEKKKELLYSSLHFAVTVGLPIISLIVSYQFWQFGKGFFDFDLSKDEWLLWRESISLMASVSFLSLAISTVSTNLRLNREFKQEEGFDLEEKLYPSWQDRFPLTHLYYLFAGWLVIMLNTFVTYDENAH